MLVIGILSICNSKIPHSLVTNYQLPDVSERLNLGHGCLVPQIEKEKRFY